MNVYLFICKCIHMCVYMYICIHVYILGETKLDVKNPHSVTNALQCVLLEYVVCVYVYSMFMCVCICVRVCIYVCGCVFISDLELRVLLRYVSYINIYKYRNLEVQTCYMAIQERWGAGVEYHFQEFNEPYAPS